MKIGYPCINRSVGCLSGRTFRLASFSKERQYEISSSNLDCLMRILEYNISRNIFFFRITSDLVPFASHPVSDGGWKNHIKEKLEFIGDFIQKNEIRISMHPDQFNVINSKRSDVLKRTSAELNYHAEVMDFMKLDTSAKIQVHVGGVYGDKKESMERFAVNYSNLSENVIKRLVIENDDRSYTISDCVKLSCETGIPVLFDFFHHSVNSSGEDVVTALEKASGTWGKPDGILMTDYSTQMPNARKGSHTESIDIDDFGNILMITKNFDYDIMLEIKDKEKSAELAVKMASSDPRFFKSL